MNRILKRAFYSSLFLILSGCGSVSDQQQVEKAKEYLAKGDQKSALIELKSALQQNPQNSTARTYLGQLYLKAGNYAAAEKELKNARELGADDNDTLSSLGQALLQLRKLDEVHAMQTSHLKPYEQGIIFAEQGIAFLIQDKQQKAIELTERALNMAPNSAYVQVARASVYMMAQNSLPKAREQLKLAFDIDKNHPAAWSLLGDIEATEKHLEQARDAYTKSMSLQPTNLADRNKRVTINILLNDMKKAQYDLDILKKKLPGNPGVAFSQGLVYLATDKLDDAKSAFDLALLNQERYPLTLFYLAYVNYKQGNIAQAETHSERYFTINPGYLPNRKLLAEIKYVKQDYEYVETLLRPVLKENSSDPSLLNILAKAMLMRGDTAEGISLLNKIVELNPDSTEAKVRLGAGLLLSGNEEAGFAQLDDAIKQDTSNHQADIFRVLSYLRLKQMEKAHQAAADFQARAPASEIPHNLSGMIYIAERNLTLAQKELEKSWSIKPGNTDAGHNLASFAMQAGENAKAREYLETIIAAHPDNLETLIKFAELDALEGKTEQMMKRLETAIRLHPGAVSPRVMLAKHYIRTGKPAQVAGLVETLDFEARKQLPVLEVVVSQQLAQEKYKSAEVTATEIVEKYPNAANGYFLMAQVYAGMGNYDKAESSLLMAVQKDERFLPARIAFLRLLVKKKDIPSIEREIARLKTFAADNQDVKRVEFALEELKGNQKQALALAESLFKTYPSNENMLALSRQRLRVGDSEGALNLQKEWADSHSDDFTANLILGETYTRLNKDDLAANYYQRALALSPDNITVLNNLAWSIRDSDPEKALTLSKKANSLKPGSVVLMDTLAMVYLANNEKELALRTIKEVRFLEPNNPVLRFHEAKINASAGKQDLAIEILTELLNKEQKFAGRSEAEMLLQNLKK